MTSRTPGDDMDEKRIESFDDLFEPFGLDEEPDTPVSAPAPAPQGQSSSVVCPSCGTHNPGSNRHCEACGARLETGPLPVAPPPLIRATPGARALGVLAAVVLVVALFAFVWSVLRDDGSSDVVAGNGDNGTTETSVTTPTQVEELLPSVVSASSQYDNFPADNLIDGDATTYWNDKGLRGREAEITFRFFQPVQIVEIDLLNIAEAEKFTRNYRIKGYQIVSDDLQVPISGTLEDVADPTAIRIASLETTELTLRVTSTHPATSYEGQPPFNELAVAEIQFFGSSG
ncbi:MAG: hypothetical protein HKN93_06955 [Acidimicrobiia bacterium]|nr:hypothetical protein [Acidimicrobiia bacterium]